jgi:acyl-CoA dehydrogenase
MSRAELAALRQSLRRSIEGRMAAFPREMATQGRFTSDMVRTFAELGLLGIRLDERWGGAAMNLRAYCLVQEELSRLSPILSLMVSSTSGLAPMAIQRHGTAEQQRRYLPPLSSGQARTCFALTEPEAGSDAAAMTTTAHRVAGGWQLNGIKHFITLADDAQLMMVMAVTDRDKRARGGVSAFLVDIPTPGLHVSRVDRTIGTAAWTLGEITLSEVFVADNQVLGEIGKGFSYAMASLDEGRLNVASICLGAARWLLEASAAHAATRVTFGAPLASRQAIQWMLADSATEIAAAEGLIQAAFDAIETGGSAGASASMAKLYASEMAFRVADRAVQIHGAAGVLDSSPIGAMFRDLRLFRIGEGASEIQRMLIARSVLAQVPQ